MNKIKLLLLSFSEKESTLANLIKKANSERVLFGKSPIEPTFCHYAERSNYGFYSKKYTHFLAPADLSCLASDLAELQYESINNILLLYAEVEEKTSENLSIKSLSPNNGKDGKTIFYSQYAGENYRLISYLCNL